MTYTMSPDHLFDRYRELQSYVGWTDDDARRIAAAAPLLEAVLIALIDDFYEEIDRHPEARKVITGGREQVDRLKGTLRQWLRELISGRYDEDYVARRWRVGWRHVEIGLDQVYTNVALSRLRGGLLRALDQGWTGSSDDFRATSRALNKLLDLDLAIIEDAYQSEHLLRQQRIERLVRCGSPLPPPTATWAAGRPCGLPSATTDRGSPASSGSASSIRSSRRKRKGLAWAWQLLSASSMLMGG
jgi:hypothetical protein